MNQSHSEPNGKLEVLLGYQLQDPDNEHLRREVFETALADGAFPVAAAQVAQARAAGLEDAAWQVREAHLLLATGQFAQARETLERQIALGMGDPVIHYNLAFALFGLGAIHQAKEATARLQEEPGELGGLAWTLWLRCQHHSVQLEEGLQAFQDVLARRSLPAEAWGVASLMALDAERLSDAQSWSDHALLESPEQLEARVTRGSLALGRRDLDLAFQCFERALQRHPTDGRSWSGIAFAHLLNRALPEARGAFQRAVASMPFHIGTWIGLGWCEVLAQCPEEARKAFNQAVALNPSFAESHGGLAVAVAALGQRADAEREVELALRLDRTSLSVRYAQALLSGDAEDPAAFLTLAERVLGQHPAGPDAATAHSRGGRTLADVVLRPTPRQG